jgi:hypothetical protein
MSDAQHLATLWASTACYGNSFTFFYVDDVRTLQETRMGLRGLLRGQLYLFFYFLLSANQSLNDLITDQQTNKKITSRTRLSIVCPHPSAFSDVSWRRECHCFSVMPRYVYALVAS